MHACIILRVPTIWEGLQQTVPEDRIATLAVGTLDGQGVVPRLLAAAD